MLRSSHRVQAGRHRGFTLIEVLVVVAIIALLISILLPSLREARNVARINVCKANAKQIATIMSNYQAENRGYNPVIFNYGAEELGHHDPPTKFAGNAMLAVAFRDYDARTRNLKGRVARDGTPFAPDTIWMSDKRKEFETKIMPAYYACPFGRDDGPADFQPEGTLTIKGQTYELNRITGRAHAYSVFQWEGQNVKNLIIDGEQYPTDPGGVVNRPIDGRPKYSILSWNYRKLVPGRYPREPYVSEPPPGFYAHGTPEGSMTNTTTSRVLKMHRQWKIQDCQRQRSAGFSDVTVIYCLMGESMGTGKQIRNLGSHPTQLGGGTNAVFADTHVEWVKGRQIGWQ